MNTNYLKFVAGTLLFALWTGLVVTGHQDAGLIDAIKFALGALGFYHAVANLQASSGPFVQPPAAPPAEQQPQPAISFPPAPKAPQ